MIHTTELTVATLEAEVHQETDDVAAASQQVQLWTTEQTRLLQAISHHNSKLVAMRSVLSLLTASLSK